MVRWQYVMVQSGIASAAGRLGRALSYFGQRGWELVTVFDKASNILAGAEQGYILFKRPVPEGQEPDGPWAEYWKAESIDAAYKADAGEPA